MSRDALSFPECVEEYLLALDVERGLASNTIAAYRRDLGQYQEYLEGREPDPSGVEAYVRTLRDKGLASATVGRKLAAVRGLHRFLVVEGLR